MSQPVKLHSQVAMITGGGSGMGRAMSLLFAENGARVAVVDIDEASARQTADSIISFGGYAIALQCDVSSGLSVQSTVALAAQSLGPINILCSNAGVLDNYAPVLDTSEELWDRIIDVNLKGMYLMARAVLPQMIQQGHGVIINTASIAGLVAGGGGAAYTASKHGVIGLTRQISFDYGPAGIRANVICPGAVETGMTKEILEFGDAAVMAAVRSVPAGRHAQPEEIASLALFLASADSSFMHGSAVVIDGGWTVR